MTLPTHAALGLLIGTLTGHPVVGFIISCAPDADHLYSYVKHGYLKNRKTFYKNAFGKEDVGGDQRNVLHNVFVAIVICLIVFLLTKQYALTFSLAYASHLFLDALDTSDYFPLYPWKKINIRGFVDFYSWQEGIIFCILILTSVIHYL